MIDQVRREGVFSAGFYWMIGLVHRHQKRPLPGAFHQVSLVAHRGLHNLSPENSLGSIRAARESGHPPEVDVQLSKDGTAIVLHDQTLVRMTGAAGRVADVSLEELRALRLRGSGGPTDEHVPTLREALATIDVGLLLEIKGDHDDTGGIERAVIEDLKSFRNAHDRVIIESFNPRILARVRSLAPEYYRCQLFGGSGGNGISRCEKCLRRHLMLNHISRPDAVAGDLAVLTKDSVRRLRERWGYAVFAWTGKTPEDIRASQELGVDFLISDFIPPPEALAPGTGAR